MSVVNTDTGCRNTQLQFSLEVHEAAQASDPLEVYVLCDDNVETDGDPSNDSVEFDLSVQDAFVLDGQDPLNYTVSYYETLTKPTHTAIKAKIAELETAYDNNEYQRDRAKAYAKLKEQLDLYTDMTADKVR